MTTELRPYTIPHDRESAGLRDFVAIETRPKTAPLGWLVLAIVAFLVGYATRVLST